MSSEHCKRTGRFAHGEMNRQIALDYVIAHPGCVGPQITAALGLDKSTCSFRMSRMTDDGDVSREITQYSYMNKAGFMCNVTTYAYTALREKTRSAGEVREVMAQNLNGKPSPKPETNPGYYKHIPGQPIKNQEGIGSGRRRVFVGSTASMI